MEKSPREELGLKLVISGELSYGREAGARNQDGTEDVRRKNKNHVIRN